MAIVHAARSKGICRVCGQACDPAATLCWDHNYFGRLKEKLRRLAGRGPVAKPRVREQEDFSLAVPFGYRPEPVIPDRVAVVIHMFYPEMTADILRTCDNIPGSVDLFISTDTADKKAAIEADAVWTKGAVEIRLAPNRGRDMLPRFVTFADVYDRGYDLVLMLHSKRSLLLRDGAHDWRETLMRGLVASPETVQSILTLFQRDPKLGLVFPQHFEEVRPWLNWSENRRQAGALAERMGIKLARARALDFPSGAMFWARPAALRPLLDLHLKPEEFQPEAGQADGTLAHVIERMLAFACEKAGFYWLKVAAPECYSDTEGMISVTSPEALLEAVERTRFRLLPSH